MKGTRWVYGSDKKRREIGGLYGFQMTAEAGCERRGKQNVRRDGLAMCGGGEGKDEVGWGSDVECVGERPSGDMDNVGRSVDDDCVRELDREREAAGAYPQRRRRGDGRHRGQRAHRERWRLVAHDA